MRKPLIITLLSVPAVMYSQDLIVKSDGSEIQAKVLSVEESKVCYKKRTNQSGPTYSLNTDKIFMIKYENGEKDVFSGNKDSGKASAADDDADGYVEKQPAANNAELVMKYNPKVEFNLKRKDSKTKYCFPVMGVEPSSVLSNKDVEMSFVRKAAPSNYGSVALRYYIEIKNKTSKIIYVDKGNSFRSVNNISTPFYDPKQVSVSTGGGSGASMGLGSVAGALGVGGLIGDLAGGLSVGGGTSSSVSTTYTQQRILAIPPHSSVYISEHMWDNYKGNKWKQISEAEDFRIEPKNGERFFKEECIEYTAENSPCKYKYFIKYSTSSDFRTYSSINANLYARYIIAKGVYTNYGENNWSSEKYMNKCYNDIIPNFVSVPSMIVGRCNYDY